MPVEEIENLMISNGLKRKNFLVVKNTYRTVYQKEV
jgi:hypothetical protein